MRLCVDNHLKFILNIVSFSIETRKTMEFRFRSDTIKYYKVQTHNFYKLIEIYTCINKK